MRELTLNEKISIKGVLSRYGTPSSILVNINTTDAMFIFGRCTGRSIKYYYKY